MKNNRSCGLDMVRVFAIFSVVILHALSSTVSFVAPLDKSEVLFLYIRNLVMASVPLFIILTGYLQQNKKFNAAHYRKIIPICISYTVISVLSIAVNVINGADTPSLGEILLKLLNFTANGYAWYFEMYICLFLLIPFLNMIYKGIKTRNGKLLLILILAFLTLVHDTVIGFSPYYDNNGGTAALNIIPDFFYSLYPFTYYFIGCFISEYRPKLNVIARIVSVLAAPAIPCAIITVFSNLREGYAWYMLNGFQTLTVCITAIAVFLALYDIDLKFKLIKIPLAAISTCSFEIYLFSYIYDKLIYNILHMSAKYNIAILIMTVFVFSYLSAFLLRLLLIPINKGCLWLYDKATKSSATEL